MSWKLTSALVAALAAGVAALYALFAEGDRSSLAFAQVVDKIATAQTLSFDSELVLQADGKLLSKNRNYYLVPGKSRMEMTGDDGEQGYTVMDTAAGQALMVDEKRKTAYVSPIKGGEQVDMAADTIAELKSMRDRESQKLGEQEFAGRTLEGFEVDDATKTTTLWADPETGEPVRITYLHKTAPQGPVLSTWTNIKFDEPLDPALFALEPPAEFQKKTFMQIDMNMTPAELVAGFVRLYADQMDGQYPPKLQDAIKQLAEKLKPVDPAAPPTDTMMQIAFYGAAMTAATSHSEQGKRWQYYPDCLPGDKDRILFWCYAKRKHAYYAVYGDLRTAKIEKSDLPEDADPEGE